MFCLHNSVNILKLLTCILLHGVFHDVWIISQLKIRGKKATDLNIISIVQQPIKRIDKLQNPINVTQHGNKTRKKNMILSIETEKVFYKTQQLLVMKCFHKAEKKINLVITKSGNYLIWK